MTNILQNYDLIVFLLMSLSTIVLLIQSWTNIAQKKVTKFSLDALILFLINLFGSEQLKKNANIRTEDPERIQIIGIGTLLIALGGIYNSIDWFTTYLAHLK